MSAIVFPNFLRTIECASIYLFILEYMQDVARIDDPLAPAAITLYQLKKKEGSVWDLNSLAGLTEIGKLVKATSPLAKILKSVLGFKTLSASAEFVSNTRFNVKLAAGGTALQMDYVSLEDLTTDTKSDYRFNRCSNDWHKQFRPKLTSF